MSAQGRGAERVANDNYSSPSWCVRRLFEAVPFPRGRWLEPCCGEGAIVRAAEPHYDDISVCDVRQEAIHAVARMQSPKVGHFRVGDYRFMKAPGVGPLTILRPYMVIVTNPPYSLADELIPKMLQEAEWVACLMRSSYGVHSRWMRNDMPDTYDLPDRPTFVATGVCAQGHKVTQNSQYERHRYCMYDTILPLSGQHTPCNRRMKWTSSDASEYSWLVWTPERGRRVGKRMILESTPLAERKMG